MPAPLGVGYKMNQPSSSSRRAAAAPPRPLRSRAWTAVYPRGRLEPPWTPWPSASPSAAPAPGDAADRARITPETELDVPIHLPGRRHQAERTSPLRPSKPAGRCCLRLLGRARYQAHHIVYPHTSTPRYRAREWRRRCRGHRRHRCRRPSAGNARPAVALDSPLPAKASWAPRYACAPTSTPPST